MGRSDQHPVCGTNSASSPRSEFRSGLLVPVAGPGGVCIGHVRHDELAPGRQVRDRRVVHGSDAESRSDQLVHHVSADRSDADDGVEIGFWLAIWLLA